MTFISLSGHLSPSPASRTTPRDGHRACEVALQSKLMILIARALSMRTEYPRCNAKCNLEGHQSSGLRAHHNRHRSSGRQHELKAAASGRCRSCSGTPYLLRQGIPMNPTLRGDPDDRRCVRVFRRAGAQRTTRLGHGAHLSRDIAVDRCDRESAFAIAAVAGETEFVAGAASPTLGFRSALSRSCHPHPLRHRNRRDHRQRHRCSDLRPLARPAGAGRSAAAARISRSPLERPVHRRLTRRARQSIR